MDQYILNVSYYKYFSFFRGWGSFPLILESFPSEKPSPSKSFENMEKKGISESSARNGLASFSVYFSR